MSDIAWITLKNIVVVITAALGIYYISAWMALFLLLYSTMTIGKCDD